MLERRWKSGLGNGGVGGFGSRGRGLVLGLGCESACRETVGK